MLSKIIYAAALLISLPLMAQADGFGRTEYVTVSQPRQQCWNERVAVSRNNNGSGALIGGIAGGIIGNQVGRGDGRVVATAIGAVTGSIVGERLSQGGNRVGFQTVQRCRIVYEQVRVPVSVPNRNIIYVDDRSYYGDRGYRYRNNHHNHHHRHHRHHRHCGHQDYRYR